MEILGYILSVFIGISLGLTGSGGSVLTVPVLVYLMNINPLLATTSSLFIVGITSLFGGIQAYKKKQVDFRAVTEFGLPSIFSIYITRHYMFPALPAQFTIAGSVVTKEVLLMIFFAVLMIAAAISMLRNYDSGEAINLSGRKKDNVFALSLLGITIGLVTGLLGAGGGFLIIPALVIFLRLPMKRAVGTSLLIIAINSLFGFLFSLKQFDFDWQLLILFTIFAITGILIGGRFAEKISSYTLKKIFGWFVLIMGIGIIIKELFIK